MSIYRKALDWEGQIKMRDRPAEDHRFQEREEASTDNVCSMCGEFCAMKIVSEYFKK